MSRTSKKAFNCEPLSEAEYEQMLEACRRYKQERACKPEQPALITDRNCKLCGVGFLYDGKKPTQEYCGPTCAGMAKRVKERERYARERESVA